MTDTIDIIREKLAELAPISLEIQDDSAAHAGHRGNSGGGHFSLSIRSAKFNGVSQVERHRMIFHLLRQEMQSHIHALSIRAIASDE